MIKNGGLYEKDETIKSFLEYIQDGKVSDKFSQKVNNKIKQIKENKEWSLECMTLLMKDQEKFEEGFAKGIEQERKQSIIKQIKMLKEFNVLVEKIIDRIMIDDRL